MQYLDNNMDELFQKAAEKYPLKTPEPDWNKVEKALQATDSKSLPQDKKGKGYRKFLWLLMLLPLGFICTHNLNHGFVLQNGTGKIAGQLKDVQQFNNVAIENDQGSSSGVGKRANTLNETMNKNRMPVKVSVGSNVDQFNSTTNTGVGLQENIDYETYKFQSLSRLEPEQEEAGQIIVTRIPFIENAFLPQNDSLLSYKNDRKPGKQRKERESKGFYLSIIGGGDISTVKMQTVEHIGYGVGVLLGYQFSKKWAIEGGMLWDKKQYYSNGEYFDKSKISIPSYVDIINLNGYCKMLEIPVSARYNFSSKKNGNFFATAGLTSYLMKKENYTYYAGANGSYYNANRTYNNSGNSFLSVLAVSAGYEYKLGKIGSLRAEPYLKIPLKGVGIGNLPISSIGINVGITHHFRKKISK